MKDSARQLARRVSLAALAGALLSVGSSAAAEEAFVLPRPLLLDQAASPTPAANRPPSQFPVQSWQLPPVEVVGQPQPELKEEEHIGAYAQPRWTAHRRFTTVRSYVIPQNEVDVEYWMRDVARHGPTELNQMQEIEFGLPFRLQLDLYLIERTYGTDAKICLDGAVEIRWALADWGKIWGNPAFYIEYMYRDEIADKLEAKFLLTDEIAPRWHWSANGVWEHEMGDSMENTYELTLGLSYTLADDKFSLGGEIKTALNDEHGNRGDYTKEFYIGPSLQWRPTPRLHLDLAPLFGLSHDSDAAQLFFIAGYEF